MALRDLAGTTWGRLTVIERAENNRHGQVVWRCVCSCGGEKAVLGGMLTSGRTQSCGCYRRERTSEATMVDITGQTFGYLTVLERAGTGDNKATWRCRCLCGNECVVIGTALRRGTTKSCGCYNKQRISERSVVDITGCAFGRLTAITRVPRDDKNAYWLCVCECGREVIVVGINLRNGNTRSCGCYKRDIVVARNTTHGQSRTPRYRQKRDQSRKQNLFVEKLSRQTVFKHHGYVCALCGHDCSREPHKLENGRSNPRYATWGHIIPLERGGADLLDQARPECMGCNSAKRDKLDEELFAEDRQRVKNGAPPRFPALFTKMTKARKRPRRVPSEPNPALV